MYQFDVVTLFPEMFEAVTESGVTGRARERKLFELVLWNPRSFAANSYRTVDDRPYGGGPGMVMMAGPLEAAVSAAQRSRAEQGLGPAPVACRRRRSTGRASGLRPIDSLGRAGPDYSPSKSASSRQK